MAHHDKKFFQGLLLDPDVTLQDMGCYALSKEKSVQQVDNEVVAAAIQSPHELLQRNDIRIFDSGAFAHTSPIVTA